MSIQTYRHSYGRVATHRAEARREGRLKHSCSRGSSLSLRRSCSLGRRGGREDGLSSGLDNGHVLSHRRRDGVLHGLSLEFMSSTSSTSEEVQNTHVIDDLGTNPNGSEGRRLDDGADLGNSHEVRHDVRDRSRLDNRHLVRDCRSLGLLDSLCLKHQSGYCKDTRKRGTHVVNDLRADPDAGIGGRLDDRADLGNGHEVRLRRGLGGSRSLSRRRGRCVDVDLGAGLGRGERVLDSLRLVDNFGRYPDAGCRDELRRGDRHEVCLGDGLDVGHGLSNGGGHGDCGRDSLGLQVIT